MERILSNLFQFVNIQHCEFFVQQNFLSHTIVA